jgi:hypothetical protein
MSNFHAVQEAAQKRRHANDQQRNMGKPDRDDSAGRRAFVLRIFGHFERTCDADASGEKAMTDDLKPLPDQEPMRTDWFITQLGNSQQKVMSLTVTCRRLEMAEQRARERAEVLEELVMDIVADMQDGVLKSVILERINKVMQKLDGEDQ